MIPTPYKITVNGTHPTHLNASLLDDGLDRWIYCTYPNSNIKATITTEVLPPTFPSASLITLVIIVSTFLIILVAVTFHKKRTKSKDNDVS